MEEEVVVAEEALEPEAVPVPGEESSQLLPQRIPAESMPREAAFAFLAD